MLNTLVKPNDIIEHEPRNILVSHHSQGNILKITLKLQPYMITCFFVRQLFVPKIFQFMQFQTWDSRKYLDQTIKVNFEQKHLLSTVTAALI